MPAFVYDACINMRMAVTEIGPRGPTCHIALITLVGAYMLVECMHVFVRKLSVFTDTVKCLY